MASRGGSIQRLRIRSHATSSWTSGANADALRLRDPQRATAGAGGAWLVDLRQQMRSCRRQADLRLELSSLESGPDADAWSGPGAAQDPCLDQGRRTGRRLSRPATEARASTRLGALRAIPRGGSPTKPLRHRRSRRSDGADDGAACCACRRRTRDGPSRRCPASGRARRRSGSTSAKAPSASASPTTWPP